MSINNSIIAIYIGDELYSSNSNIIQILQDSPLTCPILSLVNEGSNQTLVYNENDNPLFNTTGDYTGPKTFIDNVNKLRGGNIDNVYISFSTNGTQVLNSMTPKAQLKVLSFIKEELKCDGIDLDYEGDIDQSAPIYGVAEAVLSAKGLKLTAAPYTNKPGWQSWVKKFQGLVSWLNLQCYSGGVSNNPGDWLDMGVPIVAGSSPNGSICSPSDMQQLFTLWVTGQITGSGSYCDCWNGKRNTKPQVFAGGFIWSYSGTNGEYSEYITAVQKGLSGSSPLASS
jgi:hypothetical protein